MTTRTSVIIPTFNRAHLLPDTIAAVLAQTRPVDEILVINDGSTDDTKGAASRFGDAITLINRENAGKAAALNHALTITKGDAIWIVDDDDLPRPHAHETLAGLLAASPEARFAYGRHDRFQYSEKTAQNESLGTGYWGSDDPERFLVSTMEDFYVHQPGMLVMRRAYELAGPFDEALAASEDYDMLIKLARLSAPVHTDRIVFDQRVHGGLRGKAGEEYAAAQRDAKWQAADQVIFSKLFDELALDAYLPESQRGKAHSDRSARLQRATIFARRRMWEIALEDLDAAAFIEARTPLDDYEIETLRRLPAGKYGAQDFFKEREIVAALGFVKSSSEVGAQIAATIASGLRWRVRDGMVHGRIREAAGYAKSYFGLR